MPGVSSALKMDHRGVRRCQNRHTPDVGGGEANLFNLTVVIVTKKLVGDHKEAFVDV